MLRRFSVLLVAVVLVSCSSSACPTTKCTGGITFYVAEVAGSLARGTSEPLHICFDSTCQDVVISRANAGGTIFVPFSGVGTDVVHDITVTGAGALKGDYKGKLAGYIQKPNGAACAGSCALASVKIGADGTLTPGIPAAPTTSTSVAAVDSTSQG
jgi:hypothetical protein